MQVQARGRDRKRVTRSNGRGEPPDPLGRLAAAGNAARRCAVEDHPANDPVGAGGPSKHEPVARGDGDRSGQPEDGRERPVGQIECVPAAPPDARFGRGRPGVDARAGAIRQWRREPDEHSIAGRDRRVVGQDEAPM